MKKILGVVLSLLLCVGCANKKQEDLNTITVWHWMTDRDKAFVALAKRYEAQTGIKIKFELYAPSDIYSQKVIAAAQARVLPDVYGILDQKSVVASFIQGGYPSLQ